MPTRRCASWFPQSIASWGTITSRCGLLDVPYLLCDRFDLLHGLLCLSASRSSTTASLRAMATSLVVPQGPLGSVNRPVPSTTSARPEFEPQEFASIGSESVAITTDHLP